MSRPPLYDTRTRRGRALLGLLAPLLVLSFVAACGKKGDPSTLPDGATLLSEAAAAMRLVQSAHSRLEIDGTIPDLPLTYAEGDISRAGDAEGTLQLTFPQLIEVEFKILGGKRGYLKYPTGGWVESTLVIMAVYNPAVLLDADNGVANALAKATNARTEKSEKVNGVDTYKVNVDMNRKATEALVPGKLPDGLTGTFWIDKASKRMVKVTVVYPASGSNPAVPVTLSLNDFDKPVTVSAP